MSAQSFPYTTDLQYPSAGLNNPAEDLLCKLPLRRRINRIPDSIPDLLRTRRNRRNIEIRLQLFFVDHVFENEFCHWGTADIAVADKKYFYHCSYILLKPFKAL